MGQLMENRILGPRKACGRKMTQKAVSSPQALLRVAEVTVTKSVTKFED